MVNVNVKQTRSNALVRARGDKRHRLNSMNQSYRPPPWATATSSSQNWPPCMLTLEHQAIVRNPHEYGRESSQLWQEKRESEANLN
jgi:hypothetical protein